MIEMDLGLGLFEQAQYSPGPLEIEYVGGMTADYSGNSPTVHSLTSLTGGIGTEPEEDDLIVLSIAYVDYGGTDTTPALTTTGYTEEIHTFEAYQSFIKLSNTVFSKVVGSTPDTEISLPVHTDKNGHVLIARVYRGADLTTPFETSFSNTTTTATNLPPDKTHPNIAEGAVGIAFVTAGFIDGSAQTLSGNLLNEQALGRVQTSYDMSGYVGSTDALPAAEGFTAGSFSYSPGPTITGDATLVTVITSSLKPANVVRAGGSIRAIEDGETRLTEDGTTRISE